MIEHLWNGDGYRCIAFINQHGTLSHKWFEDTAKAESFARWLTAKGTEVWYAVALFKEPTKRRQDNVASVGALFLDLDCGEGKDFVDQSEAVLALRKFCEATGLPRPTIVNSGRGIHAYWLTPHQSGADWKRMAEGLKGLCVQHGLPADPSRTGDSASLLRLPGTYNNKNPQDPKVVQILVGSEVCDNLNIPKVELRQKPPKSAFDIESSNNPTSDVVVSRCQQARHLSDTRGNVEEPLWFAGLGLARHFSDADTAVYAWSDGHPDYDPQEVDSRVSRLEEGDIGPTTCERFNTLNPGGCDGCPLRGGITSPIQIRVQETVPEVVSNDTIPKGLVAPGHPWVVNGSGVFYDPSDEPPVHLINVPLYISKLGKIRGEVIAVMTWRTKIGTWMSADLPLKTLAEPRSIRGWLLSNSIVGSWTGKEPFVIMYISDIVNKIQEEADPTVIADQFGWQGSTRFLIGRREISPDGTREARPAESITRKVVEGLAPQGSRAEWMKGVDVLNKPGYEHHAFTLLASMAAPILNIMDVSGAVLSLAGPSGTGKSTSQKFALSVFGKPDSLLLSPDSTYVAKNSMMKTANNLPVAVDDISGKHTHEIGGLMYMAANGRAKERGNQAGDMRDTATWQTVLIISTNNPVMDLPEKFLVEAERRRVLELPVNTPMHREDAIILNDIIKSSYGVISDDYIKMLIRCRDEIEARATSLWQEMLRDDAIPDQNRFGVWLCAAAQVAGEFAKREGLIFLDTDRIVQSALGVLKHTASEMVAPEDQIEEVVSEYIRRNSGRFSRKTKNPNKWITQSVADIRGTVAGCIVDNLHELYVPVNELKSLTHEMGIPSTALTQWITANKIVAIQELLMPTSLGGKQVRCYKIPYTEEE